MICVGWMASMKAKWSKARSADWLPSAARRILSEENAPSTTHTGISSEFSIRLAVTLTMSHFCTQDAPPTGNEDAIIVFCGSQGKNIIGHALADHTLEGGVQNLPGFGIVFSHHLFQRPRRTFLRWASFVR